MSNATMQLSATIESASLLYCIDKIQGNWKWQSFAGQDRIVKLEWTHSKKEGKQHTMSQKESFHKFVFGVGLFLK